DAADVWAQPGHDVYPAHRFAPGPRDVERAAQKLVEARAPVIVCGGGVVISGAMGELDALAQLLGAPVCTSVSGNGSLPASHPLLAGVIGTNGGVEATRKIIEQ